MRIIKPLNQFYNKIKNYYKMTVPEWIDDIFILNLVGIIGAGGIYLLTFCLKSRCRVIDCFCFRCERDPIPPADLNNIQISHS
jgi:hypothetical protein